MTDSTAKSSASPDLDAVPGQEPTHENLYAEQKSPARHATRTPPPAHEKPEPQHLRDLFDNATFEHHYQPDSTIVLHGDRVQAMYLIVSGTVRCCTIDPEGRRQIFRFAQKGAVLGVADIDKWHFTAEAVDHVILRSVAQSTLRQALTANPRLCQELVTRICELLRKDERQLLSLAHNKAPERLLQFLTDFAAERGASGKSHVALPMCRRDIADHLGLSIETVSRAFSALKNSGQIEMPTFESYRICPPAPVA